MSIADPSAVRYHTFSTGKDIVYACSLNLQKALFLNVCIYPVWILVAAYFLNDRFYNLGSLTRFLASTVLIATIIIELIRIYLGYSGNLFNQVPELAGFCMLTTLMQIPLMSFFLFNSYLDSTPTEITLHAVMYFLLLSQAFLGYFALKRASAYAKSIYLSHTKSNKDQS